MGVTRQFTIQSSLVQSKGIIDWLSSTFQPNAWPPFPRLASPVEALKPRYDVVVVGSGYGASIAASRCARAGQSVCVLERGKEWHPGQFPETFRAAAKETQTTFGGKKEKKGKYR